MAAAISRHGVPSIAVPARRNVSSTSAFPCAHGPNSLSGQVGFSARHCAMAPAGSAAMDRVQSTRCCLASSSSLHGASSIQAGSSTTTARTRSGRRAASAPAMAPPIECPRTSAGPMSSSTASVAAYIASIGSSDASSSAVNRSEPPCARASGATIRYDDPNRATRSGKH